MHALWLQLKCEISTKEGSKPGPLAVRMGPGTQGAAGLSLWGPEYSWPVHRFRRMCWARTFTHTH